MNPLRWLLKLWHWQTRRIDLLILWPACKRHASSLAHAKAAFAVHALHDRAWAELGHDGITNFIDELS